MSLRTKIRTAAITLVTSGFVVVAAEAASAGVRW